MRGGLAMRSDRNRRMAGALAAKSKRAFDDKTGRENFGDMLGKSETRWGKDVEMLAASVDGKADARDFFFREPSDEPSRERFVETAYWNPTVVTGKDGKTRVQFKAPSALSAYRITAHGVTGAETLAGQTTSALTVRKDFFVDLKVPRSLTQGDKPRLIAQIHHSGIVGRLALRLAVYAGGREEVYPKSLDLGKDGVDEVMFEPFEVPDDAAVRFTLKGTVGDHSDELVVEVPIRPWGVEVAASDSGTSSESTTAFVGLPAGRSYESPEMLIVLSPTVERLLVELALGDAAYPALREPKPERIAGDLPAAQHDRGSRFRAARGDRGFAVSAEWTGHRRARGPAADARHTRTGRRPWSPLRTRTADGRGCVAPPAILPGQKQAAPAASDRLTSAAVVWALASVEPLGLMTDVKVLDQAVNYLSAGIHQDQRHRSRHPRRLASCLEQPARRRV